MAEFPTKDKPPFNVSVLERWLNEASQRTGIAAGRLRRWLGFMIVAAMLDQARHADDGEPLFLVKGGDVLRAFGISGEAIEALGDRLGAILAPEEA
jgi:hypothetical protein